VHTNLKNILDEAGGSMQNIAKMTTLLIHYNYIETYRSVRDEFFQEPYPANTLMIVESLALPDFMVEIEAIAVLD
jgi:enamine deaminase RidA (YjgF/YER057c/UK114 family)